MHWLSSNNNCNNCCSVYWLFI